VKYLITALLEITAKSAGKRMSKIRQQATLEATLAAVISYTQVVIKGQNLAHC